MAKVIFLNEFFDRQIVTRRAMSNFFDSISQTYEKEIVLDFKNIDFVSRSCADEYLKRKLNSKKEIKEINMSSNVRAMLSLASLQFRRNMGIAA